MSAIGTVIETRYGTIEITGWDGAWRHEIYRPKEPHPSEPWNREIRERSMATGPDDISPPITIGLDYRAECPVLLAQHQAHPRAPRRRACGDSCHPHALASIHRPTD